MSRWSVYVVCSLCAAKTPSVSGDDGEKVSAEVDALAERLRFVRLPAAPARKRSAGWLCGDCFADIVSIDAGRKVGAGEDGEGGGRPCGS